MHIDWKAKKTWIVIVAVVAFLSMVGYYFYDKEENGLGVGIDGIKHEDRLSMKKNIILMGTDGRPEDNDTGRSDTLLVMMLDTKTKSISLLSIPRDTRVHIPKHGWDKINHAFAFGGRKLTEATVEEFLGIRVDNYVMVDFKGFIGLVDAIGGIDIDVEKDMYYHDTWDGFTVDLKKGRQHMDGKTAIQYVRFRDWEGDIGRVRRQQHFMLAVYEKIASEELLKHIPGLAKQLATMVKTDMKITDMITAGRALHSMMKEHGISMKTVPGVGKYINDVSYYIPDVPKTRRMIAEMQGAENNERYKSASEMLAKEYKDELTSKEAQRKPDQVKKDAQKTANAKTSAQQRLQEQLKKKGYSTTKSSVASPQVQSKRSGAIVVRVVNCSGNPNAASVAIARLRNAGFRVISGGSGSPIAATEVISTTNNGTVVSRLSNLPFAHSLRIARDGAADCDGVVMLGKNFQ